MHPLGNPNIERRNLELIQSVYPSYADRLRSMTPSADQYDIEGIGERIFTCTKLGNGGNREWIHGPENPWHWAEAQIRQIQWTQQSTFVVLRPGLGYIPLSLYPNLRRGRTAQRMLLVEDRIDLFRLALQLFDWTDVLRSDRTILVLTDNPVETIVQFFTANPSALLPPLSVMGGGIRGEEERRMMDALQVPLTGMAETVHKAARQYFGELCEHYRKAAATPARPRKVLLVEPEHDYLANPIARAFKEEGCQVETFRGNRRLLRFLNPYMWLVYTREHFPDVLLWMNRNTLSPEGAQDLAPLPIRKVLWFLDSPKRVKTSREELEATDAYFSFDRSYLPYLHDLSGKPGFPLSTAAGIRPLPECAPGRPWPERKGPDIGFMGDSRTCWRFGRGATRNLLPS